CTGSGCVTSRNGSRNGEMKLCVIGRSSSTAGPSSVLKTLPLSGGDSSDDSPSADADAISAVVGFGGSCANDGGAGGGSRSPAVSVGFGAVTASCIVSRSPDGFDDVDGGDGGDGSGSSESGV